MSWLAKIGGWGVHRQGLDVGGFDVRVAVEEPDCVLAPVACEVAVMAVNHGQAGSHVAREVED